MPLLHGVRNGTKAKSHDCEKDGSDSDFCLQKDEPEWRKVLYNPAVV
ncbi:MAG: hypothetical protein N2V72_00015 [Methanophagales archaeon]|nr:hypothetical protein [Methanophagales archaeon]